MPLSQKFIIFRISFLQLSFFFLENIDKQRSHEYHKKLISVTIDTTFHLF